MVSFFSHGFASGGSASKKEDKKKEKATWVPIVDGHGQTINWQNSVTGAFYYAPAQHVAMVPPMALLAQPVAQQVFQPAMQWGCVMPMPPAGKKKDKDKENEVEFWDSLRDERGVRYYQNSRTHKITYFDPYY